jgi:glycosyltransferase involved in cell wall biosynthesis
MWTRRAEDWSTINLNLVPISTWLADCVRESPLFRTTPIDVIPNGIDTSVFSPQPREVARSAWGLEPRCRYILFGAFDALRDDRKGFPQLVEALHHLAGSCWSRRAKLLVFGDLTADTAPELAFDARFLGPIHQDHRLASLYAAADVMVVPSVQEAFGKTIVEAMACGTPVVAFAQGGPVDIVSHRESGYLARPVDSADLADGIAWCIDSQERAGELGRTARRHAVEQFDIRVVARRYRDLYERVRERRR